MKYKLLQGIIENCPLCGMVHYQPEYRFQSMVECMVKCPYTNQEFLLAPWVKVRALRESDEEPADKHALSVQEYEAHRAGRRIRR